MKSYQTFIYNVNNHLIWRSVYLTFVLKLPVMRGLQKQGKKVCKATAARCVFVFVCWHCGEAMQTGHQQLIIIKLQR